MIAFERMQREFSLKVRVGKPRIVHRETIAAAATVSGGVDRVLDAGATRIELKATCTISVAPNVRGEGIDVTLEPRYSPAEYEPSPEQLEALEAGVMDSLAGGPVEGSPLQDVTVALTEVAFFGAASSPQALRIAAASAVRAALLKAGGQVLQPIMKIEVVVPEDYVGRVLGDLQSRGATIVGQSGEGDGSTVDAECGLSQLLGYATDLRSNTRGRGQFVMEFNRFDVL